MRWTKKHVLNFRVNSALVPPEAHTQEDDKRSPNSPNSFDIYE
jgi:hypothetical protein